ncbi:alpha/beta fold hydrolase [Stakelama tenebrarum]|uniref:Alpha/beta hydrolase n=1 Tax=Stakelama tenebrarum TaxID=2711215 RepID=A0A6G6Y731_9SPHN|nr:alpha/beta hydrolase [Sphingosinithalassobacter tenebrarum]QIG80754.1 alpha/beta hydrolase [Sphingosinithalassobacter tenebrarum]
MATYVLVHGGGHGGWCYKPVARLLRRAGHDVYTPTMTGEGERAHLLSAHVGLDMQITDIVNVLQYEDLRDVILVGHSYGGMIITGVADRIADRVGHLVYLDAAWPKNGQSLEDHAGPMMQMARAMGRVVDGIELTLFPGNDPMSYYGVTDPATQAWMRDRLTPHPWRCFEDKLILTNEAETARIPQSHIVCTYSIPGRDMPAITERAEGRVWEIDTGHDLMLTEPEKTAELLLRVAPLMGGAQ